MASVHDVQTWRCDLEGSKFTLVTDHGPNTFLKTQPTLNQRQALWSEILQPYDFKREYRPSRTNVADPLSRIPIRKVETVGEPRCASALCRDVRWSKFAGTGKERNAFPFKKDLSRSHFFSLFLFPRTGLSSLSYLSWD